MASLTCLEIMALQRHSRFKSPRIRTDMDSDLGAPAAKSRRTAQSSKGCGFVFSILGEIDLMPVPPFSLSLAEYELLPDGHKRCFACRNVLPNAKFSGTRGVCKTCSNAQARRKYKLRQLQKKARHQVLARRHPELVKPTKPSSRPYPKALASNPNPIEAAVPSDRRD